MKIHILPALALVFTLGSGPVFAEETPALTEKQTMTLWCMGAFRAIAEAYAAEGNTTAAESDTERSTRLEAMAKAELGEDFDAAASRYVAEAREQILEGKGTPPYEENDCNELSES